MTRRIYNIIDGERIRVVRNREGENQMEPMVEIVPTKQLSACVDGIHAVDLEPGVPVAVPKRMADAYLERGDAVLPDAAIAHAPEAPSEPETPEADETPSDAPEAAENAGDEGEPADPADDADENAADPDDQGENEDVAGDQAAALAALIARGKDELHAAAKANDVKVHHNAGAEKVARALLAAGVTVEA